MKVYIEKILELTEQLNQISIRRYNAFALFKSEMEQLQTLETQARLKLAALGKVLIDTGRAD